MTGRGCGSSRALAVRFARSVTPLPVGYRLDDPERDWEEVFTFLPDEILIPVRTCRSIALVPHGSTGRSARIFSFEAALPPELPPRDGPLGPLVEARLGRANEHAQAGRLSDAETQIALFALALDRSKNGSRGV